MKSGEVLSENRKHTRSLVLMSLAILVLVGMFFGMPIIPVEGSYTVAHCGNFKLHYTDLQSLGYHLFNIGYHHISLGPLCQ